MFGKMFCSLIKSMRLMVEFQDFIFIYFISYSAPTVDRRIFPMPGFQANSDSVRLIYKQLTVCWSPEVVSNL